MYLSKITIENFRCFGEGPKNFEMSLSSGLTALVGENDAGKSAVIDALRFALGTTDQEYYRLEDSDFHQKAKETSREIRVVCKFESLSDAEKRAFLEYLSYGKETGDEPVLYVNWTATEAGQDARGRPYRRFEVNSGESGDGPAIVAGARELLRATYLQPLRDAERALSAGRGSRLSQILQQTEDVKILGQPYKADNDIDPETLSELSVLGIGDLANHLIRENRAIKGATGQVNDHLSLLSLKAEEVKSSIDVSGADDSEAVRLRRLLEKLNLSLAGGAGRLGLGSNNLLFMACELLLLANEQAGSRLLLIEEPESHLDAQRQLSAMKFLQEQARDKGIQIILTTHSPNLASAIKLGNLVMIRKGRAFSMAEGQTKLDESDYRFLQRFLDVTKANLFFARGVMIVEGDAENILLPTLARLIGRDFTEHGVSIVNVGGVGLRRYARIFQRADADGDVTDKQIDIPVACLTDMDVMPNCAPYIIGKLKKDDKWPLKDKKRHWRAKTDVGDLDERRRKKEAKADGQRVKTFVSDEWTLEYDLALGPKRDGKYSGGLAKEVFIAAWLAGKDDAIKTGDKEIEAERKKAETAFDELQKNAKPIDDCDPAEVLASNVYAKFLKPKISKPIAAQYLAECLEGQADENGLMPALRERLPQYLVKAIEYVTGGRTTEDEAAGAEGGLQ